MQELVHCTVATVARPLVTIVQAIPSPVTFSFFWNTITLVLASPLTLFTGWCTGIVMLIVQLGKGLKGEEQPDGTWQPSPHPPPTYLQAPEKSQAP